MELSIKNFEGPLDLLLTLIKENKLDINDIDVAELASKYLEIINNLQEKDIDVAVDYLVTAAHLLYLKTKILLNNPRDEEEIKEQKKDLLEQLFIYQQFKKVSVILKEKELENLNFFIKRTSDYEKYQVPEDESKLTGSSNAVQLLIALRRMFERVQAYEFRRSTIESFHLSPEERRKELLIILRKKARPTFKEIFSVPSINHFVVTMLTVLDMSRKGELILRQKIQFGDITFERGVLNEN